MTVAIGLLFFGNVLTLWYFTVKFWAAERNKTQLRVEAEMALERMKNEIRLSSSTYMKYYPTEAPYAGISFPNATANADGFYTISAEEIVWDKTIVYHKFYNVNEEKWELRKTVFAPRDNALTDTQRETQLSLVVANGEGGISGVPNNSNATTETILSDIEEFDVNTEFVRFDGYSPTVERGSGVSFGTVKLAAGEHDIRFQVTGKNENNTDPNGYGIGIDYFSVTPSGCNREAEYYYPGYYTTGDTVTKEYLSGWGGNYALSYSANAVGDYITLRFYYDAWLECNFQSLMQIDPNITVEGSDYALMLAGRQSGSTTGWFVVNQAETTALEGLGMANASIRDVIYNSEISETSNMIRFKFRASSTQPLRIDSAYFGRMSTSGAEYDADPADYAFPLYFDNAPVEEGSFEETAGAEGAGTNTTVLIPAGYYAWSNWLEYTIDPSHGYNYSVTFHVANEAANCFGQYWASSWTPPPFQSYVLQGNYTAFATWSSLVPAPDPPVASQSYIYALSDVEFWKNEGNAISQIYDTKISGNSYAQIIWTGTEPSGTDIKFKVRSSDNEDMSGAADWSSISAITSSGSSVPGSGRYAQFQAVLSNSSPYNSYPSVTDMRINWPGQTWIVDIGGRFTKKPNYGIFKVMIDGKELLKTLEVDTELREDIQGSPYYFKIEMEPRNTNLPE